MSPITRTISRNRGLLSRFIGNRSGTVAIEFGMIALPFFFMIFSIMEVGVGFTAQQAMVNSTDKIARQVLTGELRTADLSMANLKAKICAGLLMPEKDCPNLVVDLRSYTNFAAIPKTLPIKANGDVNSAGFVSTPGGAGTINHLRVFYRYPVVTDFLSRRIEGTKRILIFSSATWRNESYL
ncbi:TadE/TadG family type IV pilus assembly protein [Phyllobacterium sp. YR531]|uniref:TadE/TadG family type IV pilus assembly protein n=1 Tax=Phyllobacterium sp. YR531 TaxID=1144343 RepID=UPI00026F8F91|nr:TadE/TadG family type IV pilus assembly protein [Phyllobacterium sp. YR531]EJN05288.1 Flp pilus assembly protein TadG [Phyllobacterium sp. YR531]